MKTASCINISDLSKLWEFISIGLSLAFKNVYNQKDAHDSTEQENSCSCPNDHSFIFLHRTKAPEQKATPEVMTVSVIQKTISVFGEYVGEVYGKADVAIHPRFEGWIEGIHFKEGTLV